MWLTALTSLDHGRKIAALMRLVRALADQRRNGERLASCLCEDIWTGRTAHIHFAMKAIAMRKIFLEQPGKARQDAPELGDEYTITVTRPDGLACTDDEARLVLVECLRQGPSRRRRAKVSAQQQLEARGQMRLMD